MESGCARGKVLAMDTNEIRAAISLLLTEMEEQPEDMHEAHLKLQELLDQLRATGAELPRALQQDWVDGALHLLLPAVQRRCRSGLLKNC